MIKAVKDNEVEVYINPSQVEDIIKDFNENFSVHTTDNQNISIVSNPFELDTLIESTGKEVLINKDNITSYTQSINGIVVSFVSKRTLLVTEESIQSLFAPVKAEVKATPKKRSTRKTTKVDDNS